MTRNEELRKLADTLVCNVYSQVNKDGDMDTVSYEACVAGHLAVLESLYREAMAAGLERAAAEAERWQGVIRKGPATSPDYDLGFRDANYNLMKWCRAEAQRVKEGK